MEKFNPTLIIGLGGVGSLIVEGIYRKFMKMDHTDLEKANAVFLCLDTAEDDIEARRKVMEPDNVVKTSSDKSATIGHYIESIRHRTTVEKWFDTRSRELNEMPLNKGAAQVRMASRLAMMSAINEGKFAAIDNAITQLMSTNPARHLGNNIDIHIISSLAGGTGAGTFLQMGYYVKNSMKEHGALAPKINGYFVLADVLCDDANVGFDNTQKENTRSNTYACIKELVAFGSSDRDKGLKTFEFEYKLNQRDKSLPTARPYDVYFLMDFNGADGGNLRNNERYYDQLSSYVFLNAFSNVGDNYDSRVVNQVRQIIEADGTNKFSSIGVSKLVYPVDDLFAYFAHQTVADNMSTVWCQNDKDIQRRMDEYKEHVFYSIPDTQPDKGEEYMRNLENYKDGSGYIAAQFKQIYNSTQVLNQDMTPISPKSRIYVEKVMEFVKDTVAKAKDLNALYDECSKPSGNFTNADNGQEDINFVVKRERQLEDYRKAVMAYIDSTKQYAIRECFLVDHNEEDYVSMMPGNTQHHLNSFILEKDNEMHPLAVRYFLYDIKKWIKIRLDGHDGLRANNKKLRKQIEEDYKDSFDIAETKNKKENAQDYLRHAQQSKSGLKGITNLVSGQNPYKAAKQNYVTKSKQQSEDIHTYATDKLQEEVLAGLLDQINRLIEESENFFEYLPAALQSLDSERIDLLNKHSLDNADPSIEYVLASETHLKDIYDNVISRNASPFFPSNMAGAIYRTMFNNVFNLLDNQGFATSKKKDKKTRKEETIKANTGIIEACIAYQDGALRESNPRYATMNVMEALDEEAMRNCANDREKANTEKLKIFHHFRDRAEIFGPNRLDDEVRYINAWGVNDGVYDSLSTADQNELFGNTAIDTNPKNAAKPLCSEFFSPCEIVRANTVTLLSIDKHYPKFLAKEKTEYTDESLGTYYLAYEDVITRMRQNDSKTFTPHLDKYWHLPSYMPNIGSSMAYEKKKLFRALYGGLLFGKFKAFYDGGEYYWKYNSKTWRFIRDIIADRRVPIGIGQADALNNLFIKGLVNNPDIVEEVNDYVDEKWQEAREIWLGVDRDETNEFQKMKELDIVKNIVDFKFNIHSSFTPKNQNWFTLLNSRKGLALYNIISEFKEFFFEDLMERLITLFGASVNTKKLCKYVLGKAGTKMKDDVEGLLVNFENEGRFEPKDE